MWFPKKNKNKTWVIVVQNNFEWEENIFVNFFFLRTTPSSTNMSLLSQTFTLIKKNVLDTSRLYTWIPFKDTFLIFVTLLVIKCITNQ